jgi:hypothetical protein
MKHFFICITCIILLSPAFAQAEHKPFFLDEFTVSGNGVAVTDGSGFGVGAGIHHTFLRNYPLNLISGVDYNYISQFKEATQHEQLENYLKNVTFRMNTISIPLSLRFNIGKKIKFFIEAGAYAEFMVDSRTTGTEVRWGWQGYDYPAHPQLGAKDYEWNSTEDLYLFNGGPSGGMGVSIPLSNKIGMIVKADYRHGIKDLSGHAVFNRYARLVIELKLM